MNSSAIPRSRSPPSRPILPSAYTRPRRWPISSCGFLAFYFVWLMGADNLATFHLWQDWQDIARQMPIAVVDRPGWRLPSLARKAAHFMRRSYRAGTAGLNSSRPCRRRPGPFSPDACRRCRRPTSGSRVHATHECAKIATIDHCCPAVIGRLWSFKTDSAMEVIVASALQCATISQCCKN